MIIPIDKLFKLRNKETNDVEWATWNGRTSYNINHPNFGGNGSAVEKLPILRVQKSKEDSSFKYSFFCQKTIKDELEIDYPPDTKVTPV
jgi:hypothetical protein